MKLKPLKSKPVDDGAGPVDSTLPVELHGAEPVFGERDTEAFLTWLESEDGTPPPSLVPKPRRKPSPRCVRWTASVICGTFQKDHPDMPFKVAWARAMEEAERQGPALSWRHFTARRREALREKGYQPYQIDMLALIEGMQADLDADTAYQSSITQR